MTKDPYLAMLEMQREEARGLIPLHFCLGEVLEIAPGKLRVQADGHELDQEDLMINDALRVNFEEEMELTLPTPEMSGTLNGEASPCPNGYHSYFTVNSLSGGRIEDKKAKYKVAFRLKAGDQVLLIPDQERQKYYLVMKVVSPLDSLPPAEAPDAP